MGLREDYVQRGPMPLGDAELLALALGTGVTGTPALGVARSMLEELGGVGGLRDAEPHELAAAYGIGPAKAVRLHAALQLGRRALFATQSGSPILTPEAARRILAPDLVGRPDEELHGLFLDRRRRVVAHRTLTRGCHAFTIVDPRQVFRVALKIGASAVILAHNHPSGDPTPSAMDRDITDRVAAAGRLLGVPLLDHLVLGGDRWTSLAAEGAIPGMSSDIPLWTP
ncbi:MAG: DNA repair protein RadC [Alphaproteobacteria bacterium]|nr:DNA repair protein RadC [Alphaproteobacteria bacterium]